MNFFVVQIASTTTTAAGLVRYVSWDIHTYLRMYIHISIMYVHTYIHTYIHIICIHTYHNVYILAFLIKFSTITMAMKSLLLAGK